MHVPRRLRRSLNQSQKGSSTCVNHHTPEEEKMQMQSGETEIISSRPAWPRRRGLLRVPLAGAWCASESRRVSMCTALRANATTGRALLQPGACKPQSVGLNPGVLHPAFTLLAVAQPDSTSHSFAQESTTIPDPVAFPLTISWLYTCTIPCCVLQPRLRCPLCRLHLVAIEPNQANPASSSTYVHMSKTVVQ